MTTEYAALKKTFARADSLRLLGELANWDAEICMPPNGEEARGEQAAALASLANREVGSDEVARNLLLVGDKHGAGEDSWDAANIALMRRAHLSATCLPTRLVEETARANLACETIWRTARKASDFAMLAPYLERVVALARERAARLSETLGLPLYDALMDEYQPGISSEYAASVFAQYDGFLKANLDNILARQKALPGDIPFGCTFPIVRQEAMARELAVTVGLDPNGFRLDTAAHPSCGGTGGDIRITTRYSLEDPVQALFGVIHEAGHGIYEANLPAAFRGQPVGGAAGMAAHESQSLSMEQRVCMSDAFLGWLGQRLHAAFGGDPAAFTADNLARKWRKVERSLIRVDADEVTYPAHVAMRFELEKSLISGDLAVADIPAAWNAAMLARLGVTPPDDARGCMQDVHWPAGLFGYFPSYALGSFAAAQLVGMAIVENPAVEAGFAAADLAPVREWMTAKVHSQGSRYGFQDLLRNATGLELNVNFFTSAVRARYL